MNSFWNKMLGKFQDIWTFCLLKLRIVTNTQNLYWVKLKTSGRFFQILRPFQTAWTLIERKENVSYQSILAVVQPNLVEAYWGWLPKSKGTSPPSMVFTAAVSEYTMVEIYKFCPKIIKAILHLQACQWLSKIVGDISIWWA